MGTVSVTETASETSAGWPGTRTPTKEQHRVLTPEVMMTDWKRSNTGLMAKEASIQLWDNTGVKRAEGGAEACPIHTGHISPEVQNRVGDGGGSVVKGLNDNGEAW